MTIPATIRRARIRAGLSQQAVADALGIAEVNTVWRWEAGTRSPSAVDFLKLCRLLHIDPRDLMPPDVEGAVVSAPVPTFSHDKAASCYRYTAPAGYRFGGDLHEFTYHYGYDERPTKQTRLAAVRDFQDRMKAEPLAPCQDADCDWCNS